MGKTWPNRAPMDTHRFLKVLRTIRTDLCRFVQICTGLYRFVQICTDLYRCVQMCTDLYRFVQVRTDLYKSGRSGAREPGSFKSS